MTGQEMPDIDWEQAKSDMPEKLADRPVTEPHPGGVVLADRGDGLHWLRCWLCGREWAEKDSGAYAKGSRRCAGKVPRG